MIVFATFDTNDLLPGEPWTTAKANGVYFNLFAMAEGAVNAPRVQVQGLDGSLKPIKQSNSTRADGSVQIEVDVGERVGVVDLQLSSVLTGSTGEDGSLVIDGSDDQSSWTEIGRVEWVVISPSINVEISVELNQPDDGDTVYRYYRVVASGDNDVIVDSDLTISRWGGVSP